MKFHKREQDKLCEFPEKNSHAIARKSQLVQSTIARSGSVFESQIETDSRYKEGRSQYAHSEERLRTPKRSGGLLEVTEEAEDFEKTAKARKELANYISALTSNKYKYTLHHGNNHGLIRKIMKCRAWWIELPSTSHAFNFKWHPLSDYIKFDSLNTTGIRQFVNHFQNHFELSSKSSLFINLQHYSEYNKENVFHFMPITFFVEINPHKPNGQLIASALHNFSTFFNVLESNKNYKDIPQIDPTIKKSPPKRLKEIPKEIAPVGYDKRRSPVFTRYVMPPCHFEGHNMWLLKPTCLNRGRGIHIFNNLDSLRELVASYCAARPGGEPDPSRGEEIKKKETGLRPNSFIIQKYIESPLLVHERKFDIRVWVLLTQEKSCYFFKEGYLRTSSTPFSINQDNVDDRFVH